MEDTGAVCVARLAPHRHRAGAPGSGDARGDQPLLVEAPARLWLEGEAPAAALPADGGQCLVVPRRGVPDGAGTHARLPQGHRLLQDGGVVGADTAGQLGRLHPLHKEEAVRHQEVAGIPLPQPCQARRIQAGRGSRGLALLSAPSNVR